MKVVKPMGGCRAVLTDERTVLFGQPPEVIKPLGSVGVSRIDGLVLTDSRERGGVLLNNLEFPLYHFLFISNGLAEGRKLGLAGTREQLTDVLDLLRLTLLGPTREELESWGTETALREEWLNAGEFFALKGPDGKSLDIEAFFDLHYFDDGDVEMCGLTIRPLGNDEFEVRTDGQTEMVSIRDDQDIAPPYPLNPDQSPGAPVGFGLEILGGASGFSPHQASTGMLLCHHGSYILLDSIPFLDYHLEARGISKNQIRTLILTHLHDDHCSMFPLMLSTRRVEIITTREIFEMAMIKLARGLGWPVKSVARSFSLVEIKPGEMFDFYGLQLVAHVTVHSIPTIGVTAHCSHLGRDYRICLVGDNQSFGEISDMRQAGMLRESTEANLHALYREPFNLLVADGGMGAIHGDPADAMESQAEQVVFVHVDKLPEQFSATFSLASAGKRYTVVDGDPDIFAARAIECIQANFDTPVPGRWLNALLGDKRIVRYNRDDVILKQGSKSRGNVFLVLTGRCDVLFHNGERSCAIGTREAGDFIGEMAAVMGADARNASVVAQTPVTLCEISEATFLSFVTSQGLIDGLRKRWSLRDELARLPVLETLSTTVIEQLARIADRVQLASGERLNAVSDLWYLLLSGEATDAASSLALSLADEGGALPLGAAGWQSLLATTSCELAVLNGAEVAEIIDASPQLSYRLHQYRAVNFNRL